MFYLMLAYSQQLPTPAKPQYDESRILLVNGVEGPRQRADTVRMAGCEKRTGEEGANQRDVSKRKKTNRNLIINKGEKRNKESG